MISSFYLIQIKEKKTFAELFNIDILSKFSLLMGLCEIKKNKVYYN